MEFLETKLKGCFELRPIVRGDQRGKFVKTFNRSLFSSNGLELGFDEQFYSSSKKGIIRGLHFQIPPAHNDKIVFCPAGKVYDVVVDLRIGSPTYGEHVAVELDALIGNALFIPKGFAHGFQALEDQSIVVYNVSSEYSPENDTGIMFDSLNISWPISQFDTSDRDKTFQKFQDFKSPFRYEG